ncbi:uncharacterized protein LOC115689368 isoform X1 [Syzygium oleosum]|uniref:uncharacterized protein LOC115689368 isoform X1 n=1 Tax=Syzygium oleosum TaxID=219896 RepID=UPI0011D21543|nr:uncharacterized protein LOC115689368 isoform X1 [Syzygium oleosum]
MSGIALVLELARQNPSFHSAQSLHSYGHFSASASASAAAASAATVPFAARFLFGSFRLPVAYCDAGTAWSEDYVSSTQSNFENILSGESLKHSAKIYKIEMKPLFSAFEFRTFALTSLRSFLQSYLPLIQSSIQEEEDDNFPQDAHEEHHVDMVVPLKNSVKQIIRETTVVTTRRVLERLAVQYVSQRMAWKLLKDVPKSTTRKAQRGMPTLVYIWSVSRTTLRGQLLGTAATWLIQVGIETYRCLSSIFKSKEEDEEVDSVEQVIILGKKVHVITVKCSASLIFASIGAGLGATIMRPSLGQWIGCALGDLAGPIIVSFCFEKYLQLAL